MPSAIRMSPISSAMTARRSLTYFSVTRAPRYSVLFALPLLLAYEALAAMLSHGGQGDLRNGADVMLRSTFVALIGVRGPLIFIGLVVLIGAFFVVRDLRQSGDRPRLMVFGGMLLESAALAAAFGAVVGLTTAKLLGAVHSLSVTPLSQSGWSTRLMLSLGAGLYEELFFRVLLVTALAAASKTVLGFGTKGAGFLAAIVGALVFSAAHYIGPYGDTLQLQSFTFRFLSGLAFSGLYIARGFGITAWTHALYDSFLLLL